MLEDHARMVGLALAWTDVIVLLAGLVLVVKHVSLALVLLVITSIVIVCIHVMN